MAAPRKIKATVSTIKRFADGVTAFTFKPESRCKFRSGQFLHLALDPYDPSLNWPESRVFSIANSPLKSEYIEILVAPKGDFTRKIVNTLVEGQEVWLKLPFGEFNFKQASGSDVILIAGGTGISPFIAFLEELWDQQNEFRSVHLYYGVRNRELVIYNELFTNLLASAIPFHLNLTMETETEGSLFNNQRGILDIEEILKKTAVLKRPVYYLSGPKLLITSLIQKAKNLGIEEKTIFYDKWE
jgi:ferredoxin-NADP reductase